MPLLFTGDTLFPGGPGNTSFENADFDTIITSIASKLFTFPDDTIVLPGHGLDTTIGTERPHLDEWIDVAGSGALRRATDRPHPDRHRRPPADTDPCIQHPGHGVDRGTRQPPDAR